MEKNKMDLTPSQFHAGRSLADVHGHTWGGVPDGILDPDAIWEWSSLKSPEWVGIGGPAMEQDMLVHVTGTGRLKWSVNPQGNILFEVFRPGGTPVATLILINGDEGGDEEAWHADDLRIRLGTSEKDEGKLPGFSWQPDLRDDLLYERHVECLVSSLEALGVEDGRAVLAPLFQRALPDPYEGRYPPETYWTRQWVLENEPLHSEQFYLCELHHRSRVVAVADDRTATYAVLLLKEHPDMDVLDALNRAGRSRLYRPNSTSLLQMGR